MQFKVKKPIKFIPTPQPDKPRQGLFWAGEEAYDYSKDFYYLPQWYNNQAFKSDVLAMFQRKPMFFINTIKSSVLGDIPPAELDANLEELKQIYHFYTVFPHTKLYGEIMDVSDNDPYEAANLFLTLLLAHVTGEERWKGKGKFGKLLKFVLSQGNNGLPIPFMPGGKQAGKGHHSIKWLKRAIQIQQLLPKLKLRFQHAASRHVDKIPVYMPEDDVEPRPIQRLGEVHKVIPADLALPDLLFYQKLVNHQLRILQHYKYHHKSKKFVMLLDVSGSMEDKIGGYPKYIVAIASAIALWQNCLKGGNEVVIIPFDSKPHNPIPPEDLVKTPFSGGGTSIDTALERADEEKPDEIILVTDGEDSVYYKPKAPLFTIFCGGDNEGLRKISRSFEVSDKYVKEA